MRRWESEDEAFSHAVKVESSMPFFTGIETKDAAALVLDQEDCVVSVSGACVEGVKTHSVRVDVIKQLPLTHLNQRRQVVGDLV